MAKVKMVCPFSGKMCIECGIFRGRHAGFCYVSTYRGNTLEEGQVIRKPERKVGADTKFDLPEIPITRSNWRTLKTVRKGDAHDLAILRTCNRVREASRCLQNTRRRKIICGGQSLLIVMRRLVDRLLDGHQAAY
jgi:hypothetical protein